MKEVTNVKYAVKHLCAVIFLFVAMFNFSACGEKKMSEVSPELAKTLMETYLGDKGFDDDDFLAEDTVMEIGDVRVYVFAWRTKEGENADRLLGMYAISTDGKSFYEYQSARNEWIRDMES